MYLKPKNLRVHKDCQKDSCQRYPLKGLRELCPRIRLLIRGWFLVGIPRVRVYGVVRVENTMKKSLEFWHHEEAMHYRENSVWIHDRIQSY